MGIQLGFMYQIMDDYKDKEKDTINANYVLSMGIKKTIKIVQKSIKNRQKIDQNGVQGRPGALRAPKFTKNNKK